MPDMGRPIWAYTPNMGLKYGLVPDW